MIKIICVGDCGIDYYENIRKTFVGGISFNFAVNAKQLGADVALISCIGSEDAHVILPVLNTHGLDISHMKIKCGKSAKQNLIILQDGTKQFTSYNKGVLSKFNLNTEDLKFIKQFDVIACPLSDGIEHIFETVANMNFDGLKIADFSIDYGNKMLFYTIN